MPDTNILVDNLADLRGLAETGDWQLRVPTTVMVELEGLARSGTVPAHNGRKYFLKILFFTLKYTMANPSMFVT